MKIRGGNLAVVLSLPFSSTFKPNAIFEMFEID